MRWAVALFVVATGCGDGDAGSRQMAGMDAAARGLSLSFAAGVDHPDGSALAHPGYPVAQAIVGGDWNGDGALDLAVANTDDAAITVLLGDGRGGFAAPLRIPTKGRPTSLAAADFDGDGKSDIAAGYDGNVLSLIRGTARPVFGAPEDRDWPDGTYVLATGDFDGDKRADLAAAPAMGASVTVGLGDGNGGFTSHAAYALSGIQVVSLAAGDLNADARDDLVVAAAWQTLEVLLARPGGALSRTVEVRADGATLDAPVIANFDHDGHADVVVTDPFAVRLYRGDGAGQVTPHFMLALGGHAEGAAVADFDLDGNLDVAIARDLGAEVVVLAGSGTGQLKLAAELMLTGRAVGLVVGDWNGDGKADIAATQGSGGVRLFLNASR